MIFRWHRRKDQPVPRCGTCGHSVRDHDMAVGACAAPISVGSGCGLCQCVRFVRGEQGDDRD